MTFTGFKVAYPEYEIVTPQTKKSFAFRSLTVSEEERMKGSMMTATKIAEHLNKCIFDSIVKRPEDIATLDDFTKKVTLKDRDALLYALYHITYEEIRNYEVTCTKCSKGYNVTIEASKTFNYDPYPGDDILSNMIKVDLPITQGVSVFIKQPTLFDELFSTRELGSRPDMNLDIITETLIIDRFEEDNEKSTKPKVYKDRVDVVDAYKAIAAKDKRTIYKAYEDNFGKYGISLKMKTNCRSCGNEDVFDIDLVDNFFRAMYSV